ncbi:uncharacterized protein [Periplaneta americana]|uniref:uncharacterized protein isoform X3 n=1 Tax=Periplaneta americana TaxID=6978 RepID=UPI0037E930E0
MDVIKIKPEIDPLAIERSHNSDIEEQKKLSKVRKILDLQLTEINTKCVDHSYDLKSEITFDETPVVKSEVEEGDVLYQRMTEIKTEIIDKSYYLKSEMTLDESPVAIDFPIMKSEVEEEAHELNKVEGEVKLEVTEEEDETLSERPVSKPSKNGLSSTLMPPSSHSTTLHSPATLLHVVGDYPRSSPDYSSSRLCPDRIICDPITAAKQKPLNCPRLSHNHHLRASTPDFTASSVPLRRTDAN